MHAFSARVPPIVLQTFLIVYDSILAERLISGFTHGFSTGCRDPPFGRALANLPSCQEAPYVIDAYIARERQAGRLAGPFPAGHSEILNISPIGLAPKKSPALSVSFITYRSRLARL